VSRESCIYIDDIPATVLELEVFGGERAIGLGVSSFVDR